MAAALVNRPTRWLLPIGIAALIVGLALQWSQPLDLPVAIAGAGIAVVGVALAADRAGVGVDIVQVAARLKVPVFAPVEVAAALSERGVENVTGFGRGGTVVASGSSCVPRGGRSACVTRRTSISKRALPTWSSRTSSLPKACASTSAVASEFPSHCCLAR